MSKGFNAHEILSNIEKTKKCFSSPYHNLSVVVVDFVVIVVVVHFSHFHLLFQNHWINFNQTWHKTSLSEGDSSFFKWRARPFPRVENYKLAKIHWRNLKHLLLQNKQGQFQPILAQCILGGFVQMKGPDLSKGR